VAEPKKARQSEPQTGNSLIGENGYMIATIAGSVMIGAGAILAANRTPEAALVWCGAILLAVAVVGDRLATLEFTREGGKVTLREKDKKIGAVIGEAMNQAPEVPPPPATPSLVSKIGGSYWSQPAMDAVQSAYSSNTRREFEASINALNDQIARGTAVVKIAEPSTPTRPED
jgi:hypothetical protein